MDDTSKNLTSISAKVQVGSAAQVYADAWFRKMSIEAMNNDDEFYVQKAVTALYVQLVQLSNAAESLKDNSVPIGPAGDLSLEQLKAELVRANVILQTEELRA